MISTLAKKQNAKASKAKQSVPCGARENKKIQASQPELDSKALHRRAKELATEIQGESFVDEAREKVERIKAEVEAGTYRVDADAIAEKLMECDFQIKDRHKP